MPGQHGIHVTRDTGANSLLGVAVGSAVGLVMGLVLVDGALKMLLALLGAVFLVVGLMYPRLIMYTLVVLVACLSQTRYGLQSQGVFRLSSYILNPVRLNLYEILAYCLLAILIARRALGLLPRRVPSWVTVPCLVTALVVVLQLARALVSGVRYVDAVVPFNGQYILAAIAALWCFTELLQERVHRLHLLDLLFICAFGRAVFALERFILGGGDTADVYRISGVKVALWESADHLLFVFLIGITVAAWATRRVAGGRLAFWATGSACMALTIALSYRRTGWIGLGAAVVLITLLLLRRTERSIALVPAVLALLAEIGAASYSRFSSGGSLLTRLFPDVLSRVGPTRQDEWALAWHTILRNPIAGELTARRLASRFAFWDTRIVHNAFLFAWMKLGLAGVLSLGVLGATCVVYAVRGVRSRGPEEYIALGVVGIVPFALVLAMFETPLIEIRTMFILAVAAAFAVGVACDSGSAPVETGGDAAPDEADDKGRRGKA